MHAAVAALLRRPDPRTPLSAAEARELLALTPEHTLDLLARSPPGGLDCGACSLYLRHRQRQVRTLRGELRLLRPVAHHHTNAPDYPLLGTDALLRKAEALAEAGPCVSASSPRARPFRLPSWICCATAWNACAAPSPYVSAARWAC